MRKKIFEEYSIPKAVMTLAAPTMLSMVVTVFYNMTNTFFVGQTGDANQVAAVSLCMPIFYLLMSIGSLFGIGGATYISRLLGRKEIEKVKFVSSFSFNGSLVVSLLCIALMFIFMPTILTLSGATINTYHYAQTYLQIIAVGAPTVVLQYTLGQLLRSEGATKECMIGMVIGTLLNVILDPIFIIALNMGVTGAAIATVLGNLSSIVYYLWYLKNKDTFLNVNLKYLKITKEIIKYVFKIGIPAAINLILMGSAILILNHFASTYSDNAVAAIGIAYRVNQVPVLLMIGLSQGTQPFTGYNYAAKNFKRMNSAIKFDAIAGVTFGLICFTLLWSFTDQIIKLFINNAEVISLGASFLRIYAMSMPVIIIYFLCMNSLQAFGAAVPATIVCIFRQGICFIPSIFIFNKLFGVLGIISSQPFSDIFATIISASFYLYIYRGLKKQYKTS